jgi:heme/copper-type cytochrome/quinol oxidase subunit 4
MIVGSPIPSQIREEMTTQRHISLISCNATSISDLPSYGNLVSLTVIAKNIVRENTADMNFKLFAVFVFAAMAAQLTLSLMALYPAEDRFGTYLETVLPATYVNFIIVGIPIFESIGPTATRPCRRSSR